MKTIKATVMGVGVAALMLSCASGQQATQLTLSGLDPAKFDTTIQSKPVKLYTLKNQNGMEVCITNYGARIVSLVVPDKDGKPTDVVLGFDNIAQYQILSTRHLTMAQVLVDMPIELKTVNSYSMATLSSYVLTTGLTVCMAVVTQVGCTKCSMQSRWAIPY